MDPFLGAAIVGGVSNLIGSGLNFGSAAKNRRMQIQLNRENNQFNAEQAQLQRDWQERMYNDYSSPGAMRRQYEEAGMNPYLAMSSGSAGSVGSGSSASSAGTPVLQAPMIDVQSFGQTIGALASAIKLSKEASQIEPNSLANRDYLAAQAMKAAGDTDHFNALLKNNNWTMADKNLALEFRRASMRGEIARIGLANDVLEQQSILYRLDASAKRLSNYYYPRQVQNDLALKSAQIMQTLSQVRLTRDQSASERERSKLLIAQAAREYAAMHNLMSDTEGKRIENRTKSSLQDAYIRSAAAGYHYSARAAARDYHYASDVQQIVRETLKSESELVRQQADHFILSTIFRGVGSTVAGAVSGGLIKK